MEQTIQYPLIEISKLKFPDWNPRSITKQEFGSLRESIREFGFVEPIVMNTHEGLENEIIGGNMRTRAAQKEGMEKVPYVAVSLSLEKAKLLNLALNRIKGEWDEQKLAELTHELKMSPEAKLNLAGFDEMELKNLDEWQMLHPFKEKEIDLERPLENKCPKCEYEW